MICSFCTNFPRLPTRMIIRIGKDFLFFLFSINAPIMLLSEGYHKNSRIENLEKKARNFSQQEKYKEAIVVWKEVLDVRKKTHGEKHILVGECHTELGIANYNHSSKSEFFSLNSVVSEKAIDHFESSLEIFENTVGINDPRTFKVHEYLAICRVDWQKRLKHARMALAGREGYLSNQFFELSINRRLDFQRDHRPFDILPFFAPDEEIANAVLRHKGIVLDSILEDNSLDQLAELIKEHSEEGNKPEIIKTRRRALSVVHDEVSNTLSENSLLIEFFKFKDFGDVFRRESKEPQLAYGAILLAKGKDPTFINLPYSEDIDRSIDDLMQWASARHDITFPLKALPNLHRKLMQPIIESLPDEINNLIICPDSKLSFVPFAALYSQNSFFDFSSIPWTGLLSIESLISLGLCIFALLRFKREAWGRKLSPWLMAFYLTDCVLLIIFSTLLSIHEITFFYSFSLGLGVRFAIRSEAPRLNDFSVFNKISTCFIISSLLMAFGFIESFLCLREVETGGFLFYSKQLFFTLFIGNVFICTTCIPAWTVMRIISKSLKTYSKYFHLLLFGTYLGTFVFSFFLLNKIWQNSQLNLSILSTGICSLYFGGILLQERKRSGKKFRWPYQRIICLLLFILCPTLMQQMDSKVFDWERSEPGPFLCEKYDISYVSSGRDLLEQSDHTSKIKNALLLSNPTYHQKESDGYHTNKDFARIDSLANNDVNLIRSLSFDPLPGTETEVTELTTILKEYGFDVEQISKSEATEEKLKSECNESPKIIHLATHGFFVGNRNKLQGDLGQIRFFGFDSESNKTVENPMLRSGLALAGAKSTFEALAQGYRVPIENDGILTASEAATLKLSENWLTTLSACETGVGTSQDGEGVLGLRRAFIQAGSQNLLLTLWPVDDDLTVKFMKSFYRKTLKSSNPPSALAETQREFLVKYRNERDEISGAVRYFAPFTLTFRGKPHQ